ncbi:MAG: TetR/AcrR family transcriptional regulator [Gemmatimonadota bacterium]
MVKIVHGQYSPGRRARNKAAVRARLYDAAVAMFRSGGFDATPVEAITERADVSKGTFFNYFATKDHVLAEYHDRMTGRILERLEALSEHSAEAAVLAAMEACAEWVENDREMGRIVVTRIFGSPVLLGADLQNTRRFMDWLGAVVSAGVESGELRRDLDVPVMLSMLAAVLSSTMNGWVLDPDAFDLREMLRRKTRFVFDAGRGGTA